MRKQWRAVALAIVLIAPLVARPAADVGILVAVGDAYAAEDVEGQEWTIGTRAIRFTIEMDRRSGLRVVALSNKETGQSWLTSREADSSLHLNGTRVVLGSRNYELVAREAYPYRGGVRLDLVFGGPVVRARVTRSYAAYPDAPVIESWTTVESTGSALRISDVSLLKLAVPPGTVRWITGLDTPDEEGGPFTLSSRELEPGDRLELSATGRSSQFSIPWFMVDAERDELFGGLVWSGAWQATLARTSAEIGATLALPGLVSDLSSGVFETPHAFVGLTGGSITDASRALHSFIRSGLRDGRDFDPLVAYNTWFAYGTHVDEESMKAEMDSAADLGVELFVLDAGWYGLTDDPSDFTPGLGRWTADEARFPSGLGALTDYAHARGLKFGLWIEPERVALQTVNRPGLARERYLATQDGRYDPATTTPRAAQVCLADDAARRWALDQLVALIDEVRPDYLKWDNNFWINCTRSGHGHGAADGNFAHVRGLYEILAELRERYPSLVIENCAQGGHRIDFGLLAYTDTAWMDDMSAPSARVRHEFQGLSTVLPPAYLFAFVMGHETEPIAGGEDLPLYFRSRMPGVLGMTWRSDSLSAGERAAIRTEIASYKSIRDIVRESSTHLLTAQVSIDGHDRESGGWDVVQHTTPDGDSLVYAFAGDDAGRFVVRPTHLQAGALYEVSSMDYGVLAEATGAELMADGIELEPVAASRAHVLILRIVEEAPDAGTRR